jgi:radical SAM protein with 4Fe4S-binding SPASM domain
LLEARTASLHEERDGKHLFVWGDLGQWLVVDSDVALLLKCFAERRSVEQGLREFSRRTRKSVRDAAQEALPVIDALVERGVLGAPPAPLAPLQDEVRVSNLTFNITNHCNLRCPWCYNPRSAGNEVPVSDLIDWLATGGDVLDRDAAFIILGGEPFLDEPRLIETTRRVRQLLAGEILVSTNGTRLSDATPDRLAQANVTVQVSLDSPRAERHDAVRGCGVFDRAVATVQRLVGAGVHTVLSMVMTRHSERELEAYCDLATDIGAHEVRFIPLRRIGPGGDQAEEVPDLYECFRRLVTIVRRRPELAKLLGRDFFSILMTVCRFSRLRGNCGIGRRCLFIDANGDILPCPNHRRPGDRCGNVRTTPLAEVMAASTVLQGVRARYRLEAMPTCSQCDFRFWCAGDCRAEALSTAGSPGAPSPYCEAIKRIMTEMLWLLADGWQGMGNRPRDDGPWS